MTGIELIAEERQRQIEVEGWSIAHDDEHDDFQLAKAASCYEMPDYMRKLPGNSYTKGDGGFICPRKWPWAREYWKPTPDNRVRELQKAGALYYAEQQRIERLIQKIAFEIDELQSLTPDTFREDSEEAKDTHENPEQS